MSDEPRASRFSVIGQGTAVTWSVMLGIVGLAFWTGRLSDRVDTVQLQVPAVADAARGYTDQQFRLVSSQLQDISQRLAQIENRLDRRTGL